MYYTPTQKRDEELADIWLSIKGLRNAQINYIKNKYKEEGLQYCVKSLKVADFDELEEFFESDEYQNEIMLEKEKELEISLKSVISNNTFIKGLLESCKGVNVDIAMKRLKIK